jgi:hypothetical protein
MNENLPACTLETLAVLARQNAESAALTSLDYYPLCLPDTCWIAPELR